MYDRPVVTLEQHRYGKKLIDKNHLLKDVAPKTSGLPIYDVII